MNSNSGNVNSEVFNRVTIEVYCPCASEVSKTAKAGYPVGLFIIAYRYPQGSNNIMVTGIDFSTNPPSMLKPVELKVDELEDIKERIEKHLRRINDFIRDYCNKKGKKIELEDLSGEQMIKLKSDITENINEIIKAGKELAKYLHPLLQLSNGITKGPRNMDKNKGIWIFCEDKKFLGLWEWIYDELSNNGGRGFFWGDEFSIVSVSKDYKYDNEIINFRINTSSALLLIDDDNYAERQGECFRNKIPQLKEKKLKFNLKQLFWFLPSQKSNDFDIMHLAAERVKIKRHFLENVNANFVFLNICMCENVSDKFKQEDFISILAKNKEITIPWIKTCFEIPSCFAYYFAKEFYEVFLDGTKNVAEAVMEAKEKSNEYTKKVFGFENLGGLAYAMGGNPFACVIKGDNTSRQGEVLNRKLPHKKT